MPVAHTHTHTTKTHICSYLPQGPGSQTRVTRLSWSLWRSLTKAQHKLTIPNIGFLHSPVSDTWKQVCMHVCTHVCLRARVCVCATRPTTSPLKSKNHHIQLTTIQYGINKIFPQTPSCCNLYGLNFLVHLSVIHND